jgi:ubiquinone/menaquinone biosynthesis C-methylase UbiE
VEINRQKNSSRFNGFADIYAEARPKCPLYVTDIVRKYLGKNPGLVVDLGCGTGLSTLIWENFSTRTIGIEPNAGMISQARKWAEHLKTIDYIQRFANDTELEDSIADVVTCSQSFHWMEPQSTLREVNRILKPKGIFLTVDYDWPPVCNWEAELAYQELFALVSEIENTDPLIRDTFIRWEKKNHLANMKASGYFTFAREIVFSNREHGTARRFISLAKSQGGLQTILKEKPEIIVNQLKAFEDKINALFEGKELEFDFCYRMRIGIK